MQMMRQFFPAHQKLAVSRMRAITWTQDVEPDAFVLGFTVTAIPRGAPVKIRPSFCTHERVREIQNVFNICGSVHHVL